MFDLNLKLYTMYHIVKSKSKKFQVVNLANNGKVINDSEELNSRQACHKNIISNKDSVNLEENEVMHFRVQDDTKKVPEAYTLFSTGEKETDIPAEPKYVHGRNPSKKK